MSTVKRSRAAEQDLVDIWLFIAKHDSAAANRVLDFIEERLQRLAITPTIGHSRNDLWPNALCFPVFKSNWRMRYMVFYRMIPDGIEVARILEGHRNIANIFTEHPRF